MLGNTGSPDNEQQSLNQSQLLIYVFFIHLHNSANPSPFPRCKPPKIFPSGPQPSQQHSDLQNAASNSESMSWRNRSSCWWRAFGACGSRVAPKRTMYTKPSQDVSSGSRILQFVPHPSGLYVAVPRRTGRLRQVLQGWGNS